MKKFVITFSEDEWFKMQPHKVVYKKKDKDRPLQSFRAYDSLPKNTWTRILAEHFWIHTELPCCLSFRRGKVYSNGPNYVVVIGRCTVCSSHFKGIIPEKPLGNSRYALLHVY